MDVSLHIDVNSAVIYVFSLPIRDVGLLYAVVRMKPPLSLSSCYPNFSFAVLIFADNGDS